MSGLFYDPCDAEITYEEIVRNSWGGGTHRSCATICSVHGEIASHLLKSQSELVYWCDQIISFGQAVEQMQELVLCHRTGTSYDAYMGFRLDGGCMDEAEYQVVKARMGL